MTDVERYRETFIDRNEYGGGMCNGRLGCIWVITHRDSSLELHFSNGEKGRNWFCIDVCVYPDSIVLKKVLGKKHYTPDEIKPICDKFTEIASDYYKFIGRG